MSASLNNDKLSIADQLVAWYATEEQSKKGGLVRGYAKKPEQVEGAAKTIANAVTIALEVIDYIVIIIPRNSDYADYDCGLLGPALTAIFQGNPRVTIHETCEDIFCGALNEGWAILEQKGVDEVYIFSNGTSYISVPNFLELAYVMQDKDTVAAGLDMTDVPNTEIGFVSNTFMAWKHAPCKAIRPAGDYFRGRAVAKKVTDEPENLDRGGVEEPALQAALITKYGRCITVAPCVTDGTYIAPNQEDDPDGYARFMQKMQSKTDRQTDRLDEISVSFDFIPSKGTRRFVP